VVRFGHKRGVKSELALGGSNLGRPKVWQDVSPCQRNLQTREDAQQRVPLPVSSLTAAGDMEAERRGQSAANALHIFTLVSVDTDPFSSVDKRRDLNDQPGFHLRWLVDV